MPWKPPAQGTEKREAMPSSCFLMPTQKKYPYKIKRGGQWVPSRQGLMSAYKRARQQGDKAVASKALSLLKRHFKYEPEK